MKRVLVLVVAMVAAAAAGAYWASDWGDEAGAGDPVRHVTQGLRIEQVRRLGRLVSLEVPISDVQTSSLEGLTGAVRLVLAVRGDVQIGTDLSQAAWEEMDAEKKSAILVLPKPAPAHPRLDHNRTRILHLDRSGMWRLLPGQAGEQALTNRAMVSAQSLLENAAATPELVAQACAHTEKILGEFFQALGWQVVIRWVEVVPADRAAAGAGKP